MRRLALTIALVLVAALAPGADAQDKKHPLKGTWNVAYRDMALGVVTGKARVEEGEGTAELTLTHPATGAEHILNATKITRGDGKVTVTVEGRWPADPQYRPAPIGEKIEISEGAMEIQVRLGEGEATLAVRPSEPADLDKVTFELNFSASGDLSGTWRYRGDATTGRDREEHGPSGQYQFTTDGTGGVEILGAITWIRPKPRIALAVPIEEQLDAPFGSATWPHPFTVGGERAAGAFARRRTLLVIGEDLPIDRRDPAELESLDPLIDYFVRARKEDFGRDDVKPFVEAAWDKIEFSVKPEEFARLKELDAILLYTVMKPGVLPGRTGFELNGAEAAWLLQFGDFTGSISVVREIADDEFEATDYVFRPERVFIEIRADRELPYQKIPLFVGIDAPLVINDRREVMAGRVVSPDYVPTSEGAPQKPQVVYRSPPIDLIEARGKKHGGGAGAGIRIAVEPGDVISARIAKPGMLFTRPSQARAEVVRSPTNVAAAMLDDPQARSLTYLPALQTAARCADKPFVDLNTLGGQQATTIDNVVILSTDNPLLPDTNVRLRHGRLQLDTIRGQDPLVRTLTVTLGDHAAMLMLHSGFLELMEMQKRDLAKITGDDMITGFRRQLQPVAFDDNVPINRIKITAPNGAPALLHLTFLPTLLKQQYRLIGRARKRYVLDATAEAIGKFIGDIERSIERTKAVEECDIEELLKITGYNFDAVTRVVLTRQMLMEREGRRGFWRADRPTRSKIKSLYFLAQAVRAQEDLASADTQLFLVALSAGALPAIAVESVVFASVAIAVDLADFGYTVYHELSSLNESRKEIVFARGASAVLGVERLKEAERREVEWYKSALAILAVSYFTGTQAVDSWMTVGRMRSVRRGESILKRVDNEGMVDLIEAERRDIFAAIEYARTIERRIASRPQRAFEALRSVERRALEASDFLVQTWRNMRRGKPVWARGLSDANFERIRPMARRRDIVKLVKDNPGAMNGIIADADALDVLRAAPFEDLVQLRRAIKREAERIKDTKGPGFYEQTGPDVRAPKEIRVEDVKIGSHPLLPGKPEMVTTTAYLGKDIEVASFSRIIETIAGLPGKLKLTMSVAAIEWDLLKQGVKLPTWVTTRIPFSAKRGLTPLSVYMNLRTFHGLGIKFADPLLAQLKMSTVINATTCIQLHWLRKVYPDTPIEELVKYTHSYRYAETALQQSGFKVTRVEVPNPKMSQSAEKMVAPDSIWYDQRIPGDDLLRRYDIEPDEIVKQGYDITLHVEPIG